MVDFLRDFIKVLRASDVRISTSETIDAMNVASVVGLEDKILLKESLSQSLAKSLREKEIFEECYENFFKESYMNFSSPDDKKDDNFNDANKDIDSELDQDIFPGEEDLESMYNESDRTALMSSMALASREVGLSQIRLFTQTGMFTRKIFEFMGLEKLNNDIFQASREGNLERENDLKELRERIRLEIRDYVEQQVKLRTSQSGRQLREEALSQVRLSQVDRSDLAIMINIVRKMAKRLVSLHSRRKKKANRGQLDVRSTLRANQGYDGLLFETVWKKTKVNRPKVITLCDVSGSVANVARFFLMFLYSLSEVLPHIRTFAFSNKAGEVTDLFETKDIEEASAETLLLYGGGSTDYGQALIDLEGFIETEIDKKTTLIILGDARSNFGDPRADILKSLQEKSKRVIFLNPEPKGLWGTGDSEMKRFLPYCGKARYCSSLKDLERVVDDLLRMAF
ncbi:MAG: hypothetical protein CML87_06195 [Rhodobiaceae bacterium]|jgi:uncharacterized protein with von Willebrand factor type A (vWA) domain|nr:hypothetical protein [Rhodobiaceae bacterium]|tara:strand:+ start:5650 stop:7014 length:1365 start_codon:yes stop_codon:yes gene_type:complete